MLPQSISRSLGIVIGISLLTTVVSHADFEVKNQDGKIEVRDDGKLILGWQHQLLAQPTGGSKLAGSAFLHPLATPSGFDLTRIQPDDHLHHFGVWWPWKLVTVNGKKHNTWELQQGQGRHRAVSAAITRQSKDEVVLKLVNQSEIKSGASDYTPVLAEETTLRLSRLGKEAYVVDLAIAQRPMENKMVEIIQYRYSGFSWRGTADWNKTNSQMFTSGGQDRDTANGQPARWAMVSGDTHTNDKPGKATLLILSAASKNNGNPELLRVWDSKAHNGVPFINFNPVMKSSQILNVTNKPVSQRKYRLIIADRAISPQEADQLWGQW